VAEVAVVQTLVKVQVQQTIGEFLVVLLQLELLLVELVQAVVAAVEALQLQLMVAMESQVVAVAQ